MISMKLAPIIIIWTFFLFSNRCYQAKPLESSSSEASQIVHHLNCSDYVEEREYILLDNGSLVIPGLQNTYEYFYVNNDTAYVCIGHELTTPAVIYNFSKEFRECGHFLIEPEAFEILENGSIYIEMYSRVYEPTDYYLIDRGVYVCIPTATNSKPPSIKFSETLAYVAYAGLFISILSLTTHLIVFCFISSVRNLPGCCLASLSLSLLLAYLCFVVVAFSGSRHHCASLGMCVYYFFVTAFFWMNAIAFDVWRSFRVVIRELRISSHRVPWKRFLLYSAYSWLTPVVLTLLVYMGDVTEVLPYAYRPRFGDPVCWFGHRKSLLIFFALPLSIVMLLNAFFFLDVAYVISRAAIKTSHTQEATLKKRFFTFMRLALIMGLTWIVGIVAGYVDDPVLWYLFVILNTLQGLFILVVFSFSSKVRNLCFRRHSKKRGSTSVRTISQMSGSL